MSVAFAPRPSERDAVKSSSVNPGRPGFAHDCDCTSQPFAGTPLALRSSSYCLPAICSPSARFT